MPWLPDTPSNALAMQRCSTVHGSAAKRACAESTVAAVLAGDPAVRVARRDEAARPAAPEQ